MAMGNSKGKVDAFANGMSAAHFTLGSFSQGWITTTIASLDGRPRHTPLKTLNYDVWKYDAYTIDSKPYYVIVNETCSGINMMVALLVYILVFGWLAQSKWQTRVAMVTLVFPLAMLVNSLRVTCIYLLGYYGGC